MMILWCCCLVCHEYIVGDKSLITNIVSTYK